MPIGVAVIDANQLVPIVACDFLLTAFDHGVFEPIVSTSELDEVERTLIETFPRVDPPVGDVAGDVSDRADTSTEDDTVLL